MCSGCAACSDYGECSRYTASNGWRNRNASVQVSEQCSVLEFSFWGTWAKSDARSESPGAFAERGIPRCPLPGRPKVCLAAESTMVKR